MELKTEIEKELLKYNWWYSLDKVGWVHISHFGMSIYIKEIELVEMSERHNKKMPSILMGG